MLDHPYDLLVYEAVAKREWLAEQRFATDDIELVPTRVVDQTEGGLKRECDSSIEPQMAPNAPVRIVCPEEALSVDVRHPGSIACSRCSVLPNLRVQGIRRER